MSENKFKKFEEEINKYILILSNLKKKHNNSFYDEMIFQLVNVKITFQKTYKELLMKLNNF